MKSKNKISREMIVKALANALEPLDYVYALWEGGAVAFDRVDEWSDIDVYVDADDEQIEKIFPITEQTLESVAPIELKYRVPLPAGHGYAQAFYRLTGTSKFMVVDLAVMKHSNPDKFLEPEIHGKAKFLFNKNNIVKCPSLNKEQFINKLRARLEKIQKKFDMFQFMVLKELNRGHYIEALDAYRVLTLGLLVEALRIKYKPVRYNFKTYYVHYDLPLDVVKKLKELYFVKNETDLRHKHHYAEKWFYDTVKEIDFKRLKQLL